MSVALLVIIVIFTLLTIVLLGESVKLFKLLLERKGELSLGQQIIGWIVAVVSVGFVLWNVYQIVTLIF